jgi:hypothetical protein
MLYTRSLSDNLGVSKGAVGSGSLRWMRLGLEIVSHAAN